MGLLFACLLKSQASLILKYIRLYSKAQSHQSKAGQNSSPGISAVKPDKYHKFDYSLAPYYRPYSSTPVSFHCGYHPWTTHWSDLVQIPLYISALLYLPAKKQPSLGKILHTPRAPNELLTQRLKSSERVLTSLENMRRT